MDRPTVLIVDDNSDTLDICGRLLSAAGYRILRACDVEEALAHLKTSPAELVILDIAMPGRSGLELARAIRARPGGAEVPIIGLSGLSGEAEREALEAGCTAFCRKPVEPRRLLGEVRRLSRPPGRGSLREMG